MRIRKRSIAVLSSSSCQKTVTSTCKDEAEEEAAAAKEREFLLPLVAAVMEVQAKADMSGGDATIISTSGHEIPEIHTRPAHDWKNSLLRCNPPGEPVQVRGEGDKSNFKRNAIRRRLIATCESDPARRKREDKSGLISSEEGTLSSLQQEIACLDRERKLEKSGRTEKHLMRRERGHYSHFDVGTVIYKSSKIDCTTRWLADREEDAIKINRKQTIQVDTTKTKDKACDSDNDKNNNVHAGNSQCRRRNGRGWRCSQRTFAGYFFCEHHLGKDRLKSINSGEGAAPLVVNNKGTKFKELQLILAAAPPCEVVLP